MKLVTSEINRDFGGYKTTLFATFVALAAAAQCAGAPAASVVASMNSTSPGGFIFDGTRNWVSDQSLGFCRMDVAGGGGGGGFTLTNCVKPQTTSLAVPAIVGQPAFDSATGFLYLPDMSTASKGVWRYSFTGNTFNTPVNIASAAGLGAQQPGAVAFSGDGSIYVSMTANAGIVQILAPSVGSTQTATKIGATVSGNPATGMAMIGTQLWVTDNNSKTQGLEVFTAPATCAAAVCKPTVLITFGIAAPLSISVDNVNSFVYIGTSAGVFQNNLLTGLTNLYSTSYIKAGVPGLFSNVTAVGVDGAGNLLIVNDPTAGQVAGNASMFTVPAGSLPEGQGTIPTPPVTQAPAITTNPLANPASLFSRGLTAPTGAVFLPTLTGGHIWTADAHGFCKVNPLLPAPGLTPCAALPAGFVPGQPAYDPAGKFVYLADTAGAAGILRFTFNSTTETLSAGVSVVTNAALIAAVPASTAPLALALGPDSQLYTAMAGVTDILRVTNPATAAHTIRSIGQTNQAGTVSIGFFKADLYDAESSNVSVIRSATLCFGACTAEFVGATLSTVTAVTGDANFVYIGDANQLWRFDPVANVLALMADTGLLTGSPTAFGNISGVVIDTAGTVYAIDTNGPIWSLATAKATITSLSPNQAPETAVIAVTLTGTNFTAPLTVSTCPAITPSGVIVVSATQITNTFSINPLGPVGACAVTVTTGGGVSAAANFTVLIGPPVLTTITPATGFRGRTVPVSIAGANMNLGVLSAMPDITFSGTVITSTLITTNFIISPTAVLGTRSVIVTSPSGPSNTLVFTIAAAPPVLTSISPAQGVAATTVPVTITGTDLLQGTLTLPAGFTLSGVPVVTSTSITATLVIASTVPAGPQGITVTTPGGTSNAVTFKILPALTSIAPVTAKAGTATAVTLTGTSLNAVTTVNAGANITVSALVPGLNTLTATFTTLNSSPLGAQSITVTDANGTSNAVTFTITAPTPVLTTIAPATGATGTTVPVTITGSGLVGATLNLPAGITLSGTPVVTFSTITANLVIAVTGVAPLGPASISVTTPGGTSNNVTFTIFAPAPVLTSIAPAQGVAATTVPVTLTGTGLLGGTLNLPTGFTLSGVPVVTATSITANLVIASTVPAGPQNISVTTPGGTTSAVTFNILPNLTSIAPVQARAGAGTAVTLTGTSLLGVTSISAGVNITVTNFVVVSATTITATFTSAPAAPVGPVNVTVTGPSGTSSPVVFTLIGPVPVIASIAPVTGVRGTTVPVTITGTGLTLGTINLPAGIIITGTPVVTFTTITASLVIATDAPLGAQSITVTTPGAGNLSNAVTFTVTAPVPTLTSVAPATGTAGTTIAATFTGTGLVGGVLTLPTGFTLSGTPVVASTGLSITASLVIASTVQAGPQSITVTTPGGTSNAVTIDILPVLTSITPAQARAGAVTTVTLTGTSLSGIGVTSINAGANITVSNIVATVNSITATFTSAPAAPVGPVNVTVTVAGNTSNALTFTLTGPVPVIASISPATGGTGATVPITITGTGLTLGTINLPAGITIAGTPVVSFTQITASLLIAGNAPLGAQLISVTTPGTGNTSNTVTFTVFALAPTLTSVAPTTATAGTTVTVTLTGTGLTGTTSVNTNPLVSGITVSGFTVVSATQISATLVIAANAASTPISVTNVNGTSNSVIFGIVPTLASIAPNTGVAGKSVPVTLTGTSFTGATSINVTGLTGITVTNLVVVSSTQITATFVIATTATQGAGSITVTAPGGSTSAQTFTVLPPAPVIASLNNTTISKRSNNVGMNVNGTNLGNLPVSSMQVLLNGVPVSGTVVSITNFAPSQTQIRFNWTFLAAAPISGTGNAYTLIVTTPSGTSNAIPFTVTN